MTFVFIGAAYTSPKLFFPGSSSAEAGEQGLDTTTRKVPAISVDRSMPVPDSSVQGGSAESFAASVPGQNGRIGNDVDSRPDTSDQT